MVTARPLDWEMPTWSLPTKPSEFRDKLKKLITIQKTIGGSRIDSIIGLFLNIFADQTEEVHKYQLAIILERLLDWWCWKKEYVIYRPDADWTGDMGLSPYKLRKLREKLAPLVLCENRHNWERTKIMHYQLDGEALLSAIAKVYGKSESYIRGVLFVRSVESPKLKNPDFKPSGTKTLKPDFKVLGRNTSKSLTTLPSNNSSKEELTKTTTTHAAAVDEVISLGDKNLVGFPEQANATDDSEQVEALVGAGLWRNVARQYDWLPITTIQSMIEQAQAKKKRGGLRENVGNYLNGALQKHADHLREEYKRAIAQGQELSLIDFALQHEQTQSHKKSEFAGLTWSDLATD